MRLWLIYRHKIDPFSNTIRVRNARKTLCMLESQAKNTWLRWDVCCKLVVRNTKTNALAICSSLVVRPYDVIDYYDYRYSRSTPWLSFSAGFLYRHNNHRSITISLIRTCEEVRAKIYRSSVKVKWNGNKNNDVLQIFGCKLHIPFIITIYEWHLKIIEITRNVCTHL